MFAMAVWEGAGRRGQMFYIEHRPGTQPRVYFYLPDSAAFTRAIDAASW